MKLRILDNSIRLRLTQSEVNDVSSGLAAEGRLGLPDGTRFDYRLNCTSEVDVISASMNASVLEVQVPTSVAVDWAKSGEVSLRGTQGLPDGETLTVLVEKDFHCLSPREGEDESDLFPHPDADDKNC